MTREADPDQSSGSLSQTVAYSWGATDRFVPRVVVRPLQSLMAVETSSAALILVATDDVSDPATKSGPDATGTTVPSDGGRETEVRFHHSAPFPRALEEPGCSLLVSTYQAGQLVAVGVADGQLTLSFRGFDRAMGIAVGVDRIAVGGKGQIWSLPDHSELASARGRPGSFSEVRSGWVN